MRLNPKIQVLHSPTSLWNREDVVYMRPLTRSIKFSMCKFIALNFCYEVTLFNTLLNYRSDQVHDTICMHVYTHTYTCM